jgi:hypothetical protein
MINEIFTLCCLKKSFKFLMRLHNQILKTVFDTILMTFVQKDKFFFIIVVVVVVSLVVPLRFKIKSQIQFQSFKLSE